MCTCLPVIFSSSMNQKQEPPQIIFRAISFALGLVSILAGIVAWNYSYSREPERYLVSALVMICGGIFWLGYSILPKYKITKQDAILIGMVLFLGLTLGLLYTFNFCGGECGCFQYRGYPGYWLKGSACVTSLVSPIKMNNWNIDTSGLVADIVFWIDAGLILSFIRRYIISKSLSSK